MKTRRPGSKGLATEELLRAYFLRAGFFVVRGVLLRHGSSDLTDIDLWVYERSATLARRRTVIDIKDKGRPQAAERLFFVKGLAEFIAVEGAGVATTDPRPELRELARKHGVLWIDGADLQRLKASDELSTGDRVSEEEFDAAVSGVDAARSSHEFRDAISSLKSSVADRFGASCANTALDSAGHFARHTLSAHPGSPAALIARRATYLSAAIAAAALDFASADSALRPAPERLKSLTDVIRFGADSGGALAHLRWAEAAIREYVPNGVGIAQVVKDKFMAEVRGVPAEGLAEVVVRLSRNATLFAAARALEHAAYATHVPTFDALDVDAKSFLGAVLDFVGVS
jgi:hypothetical protein